MQTENTLEANRFSRAQWLNDNCPCTSLERKLLPNLEAAGLLFSETPVFLAKSEFLQIEQQIDALQAVIQLPEFQEQVLEHAASIALTNNGESGVFMGYDFHTSPDGPRLIEINTNAGGAFLVDALYRAQNVCCWNGKPADNPQFASQIVEMFKQEWHTIGHEHDLTTMAIVDENPTDQFLHDEFLLVKDMLEAQGVDVIIADPGEFSFDGETLWHQKTKIDLIYNRSVDFYFEKQSHAALRDAFIAKAAAITPNPRHHALYAAKQNLTILSNPEELAALGASKDQIATLSLVPKTIKVSQKNAEELWNNRKGLFFKPLAGHGGKAVYRGDKITKKTWAHILENGYVAQEIAIPEARNAKSDNETGVTTLKSDIRVFTYQGKKLLAAARLYQGQTTNFRTVGGGFAPIYVI